jgi:hypothetical protein
MEPAREYSCIKTNRSFSDTSGRKTRLVPNGVLTRSPASGPTASSLSPFDGERVTQGDGADSSSRLLSYELEIPGLD